MMVETGNKKDMKQTVEAAASENILFNHRTVDRTLFGKDLAKFWGDKFYSRSRMAIQAISLDKC